MHHSLAFLHSYKIRFYNNVHNLQTVALDLLTSQLSLSFMFLVDVKFNKDNSVVSKERFNTLDLLMMLLILSRALIGVNYRFLLFLRVWEYVRLFYGGKVNF